MAVTSFVSDQINSLGAKSNIVRSLWDKLSKVPGGPKLFSTLVGKAAPYTGSIGAKVVELRPGYSKVVLKDRPRVRNHLDCVHAVALLNLAELTGNIALSYSLPSDARFIVAGMSIDYVKKSRGTITGECHSAVPTTNDRVEYEVPVVMKNEAGETVATATLRTLVGPKPVLN